MKLYKEKEEEEKKARNSYTDKITKDHYMSRVLTRLKMFVLVCRRAQHHQASLRLVPNRDTRFQDDSNRHAYESDHNAGIPLPQSERSCVCKCAKELNDYDLEQDCGSED